MKLLARAPLSFRAKTSAALIFEPRDLWIGCFWDHIKVHQLPYLVIYFAVVPTLVLRLTIPLRGDTP